MNNYLYKIKTRDLDSIKSFLNENCIEKSHGNNTTVVLHLSASRPDLLTPQCDPIYSFANHKGFENGCFETYHNKERTKNTLHELLAHKIFNNVLKEAQQKMIKQFADELEKLKHELYSVLIRIENTPDGLRHEYVRSDISADRAGRMIESLKIRLGAQDNE